MTHVFATLHKSSMKIWLFCQGKKL